LELEGVGCCWRQFSVLKLCSGGLLPCKQFRVDIKSGEAFVAEKDGRLTPVGVKQRVHSVVENDSGVYVRLEESDPPALDSDEYATGKQFVPKNKENGG